MSVPTYALAAWSGSGKTTYLEKLLPALKERGLRVAVVKHDGHDFELDREGKDTWRLTRAGADVTAIVSATHAAVMENRPVPLEEVVASIRNVDLILVEGAKSGPWKKILFYRAGAGKPPAADPKRCAAVVTDTPLDTRAPTFALEDAAGLADWLTERVRNYAELTIDLDHAFAE